MDTCIQPLLQIPGLVNVDFADVRSIMANAGSSLMGQGKGAGKSRARDAALAATSSPLLDIGIERATGIVWNITGPADLTLFEVNEAAEIIYDLVDPSANLIFGAVVDPKMTQEVSITLIATGFGGGSGPAVTTQQRPEETNSGFNSGTRVQLSRGPPRNETTGPPAPPTPNPASTVQVPDFLRKRSPKKFF